MLLKDLIEKGTSALSALYQEREAREMVYAYLSREIGVQRHTHIVEPAYLVSDEDVERAESAFGRMAGGEPLQYVTGQADFYGRTFSVNPSVLIPRPETELLCRTALVRLGKKTEDAARLRMLDLCTGSGCIAWTMALECAGADVTAVDISDGALQTAASQDFGNEVVTSQAVAPRFIKADVLSPESLIEGKVLPHSEYDVILSNPPYVKESEKEAMRINVLDHEPHLALFVPDDDALKFYRAVASIAFRMLSDYGFGIVEINESLGVETSAVFTDVGFTRVEILKDFSERNRFVYFAR